MYNKKYYEANKEKILARRREIYHSTNGKTTKRQYFLLHKEQVYNKNKKWKENNRDKVNEINKRMRQRNPERYKEKCRIWTVNNPDKIANKGLRSKYGITLEEYHIRFNEQTGLCAICKDPKKPVGINANSRETLNVDHSHKNNQLRGLLCFRCNVLIGQARENINILKSAVAYLELHSS